MIIINKIIPNPRYEEIPKTIGTSLIKRDIPMGLNKALRFALALPRSPMVSEVLIKSNAPKQNIVTNSIENVTPITTNWLLKFFVKKYSLNS